jgi:L-alanine-DL-glutamate epimerase-like enolase superfamily enzyme
MPKITEIEIAPVGLPRKEVIALRYGSFDTLDNVFVAIRADNGMVGYGESAPIPPTFGETQGTIVEVLKSELARRLIGQDALNLNRLISSLDAIPGHLCAKSSLDIALYDLAGKTLGVPVCTLLGGAMRSELPVAQTVGIDSVEIATAKAVKAAEQGFTSLKLKGGRDIAHDLELLTQVRKALGDDGPWLRLDLNQGYRNAGELLRYIDRLDDLKIDLLEEPFPARRWAFYRQLAKTSTVPVCLDETLINDTDAMQLVADPAGFVANIKLQKNGGLHKSRALADTMAVLGIPVVIGAHRDAWISNTAGIHLAATLRDLDYACDVRYAWSLADVGIASGGPTMKDGMVTVPDGPGLGLDIDWNAVRGYAGNVFSVR